MQTHCRLSRLAGPTLLALAAYVAAGSLTAQSSSYSAYPIDDLHGGFGHWAPFGILSTGNADQCRVHQMIPAPFLPPGGALINGIAVSPHVVGNVPYERLIIRCGLTQSPTISTTFANNSSNFLTVYSATNVSINWTNKTVWQPIMFQTPMVWDGVSNLVIEFEKVVDRPNNPTLPTISHQFTSPNRRDLPLPVFREGNYSSGAATAATGTSYSGGPLLIRLLWLGNPSLTISNIRTRTLYHLGSTIVLTTQAVAGEFFGVFVDGALATTPLSVPGVGGLYWLPGFVPIGSGTVGGSNVGTLNVPIPNLSALVGGHLYFQGAVASSSRLILTNAVDAIVSQ